MEIKITEVGRTHRSVMGIFTTTSEKFFEDIVNIAKHSFPIIDKIDDDKNHPMKGMFQNIADRLSGNYFANDEKGCIEDLFCNTAELTRIAENLFLADFGLYRLKEGKFEMAEKLSHKQVKQEAVEFWEDIIFNNDAGLWWDSDLKELMSYQ